MFNGSTTSIPVLQRHIKNSSSAVGLTKKMPSTKFSVDQDFLADYDTANDIDKIIDFPMPPPISVNRFQQVRDALEHWKELIVSAKNVLNWTEPWHPTALFTISTGIFLFLWLVEPHCLTVVAFVALILTLVDFLLSCRMFTSFIRNYLKWNELKQKQYEMFCSDVLTFKTQAEDSILGYFYMRTTNSKTFYAVTVSALITILWIGRTFNNLLLTYAIVTGMLLMPGIQHNTIWNNWLEYATCKFTEFCMKIKEKRA